MIDLESLHITEKETILTIEIEFFQIDRNQRYQNNRSRDYSDNRSFYQRSSYNNSQNRSRDNSQYRSSNYNNRQRNYFQSPHRVIHVIQILNTNIEAIYRNIKDK